MQIKPRELRRYLLWSLAILGLLLALAYLGAHSKEDPGYPSSYSVKRRGAKAAYLLLEQSGYKVERWNEPPSNLPKDAKDTIVIYASAQYQYLRHNGASRLALSRFLQGGGRALIVGGSGMLADDATEYSDGRTGHALCHPAAPTSLSRGGTITQDGVMKWNEKERPAVVHYRDGKGAPVVVSYKAGEGEVIWWASALPLTNEGIREEQNLSLLLNTLGPSHHVLWDEYSFAPEVEHEEDEAITAPLWGLAQVIFLALLIVLAYTRRSGPVVAGKSVSRLSPLEFVETLGALFHRAGARQAAVEIAWERLLLLSNRRLGIVAGATPAQLAEAMRRGGYELSAAEEQKLHAARDAFENPVLGEKAALAHSRFLNKLSLRLEASGRRLSRNRS